MIRRSVSRQLNISIILTVIFVSGLGFMFNHYLNVKRADETLNQKADEYLTFLVSAVSEPIWYLNDRHLNEIADYFARNEYISELTITDSKGDALAHVKRGGRTIISKIGDVHYKGKFVGRVRLSLSSVFFQQWHRQALWINFFTLGFIVILLVVLIGSILGTLLQRPLSHLNAVISEYSMGNYQPRASLPKYIEFQPIGVLLKKMGDRITEQISQLEQYSTGLEAMVTERTAELDNKLEKIEKQRRKISLIASNLEATNQDLVTQIAERRRVEKELEGTIIQLQDALKEVKTLQGFIPICATCKNIRDDEGYWQKIEEYIQDRSDAKFSHGICPHCTKELYPDLYEKIYGDQVPDSNPKRLTDNSRHSN